MFDVSGGVVNCAPVNNNVPPLELEYQFIVVPAGTEFIVNTAEEPEQI